MLNTLPPEIIVCIGSNLSFRERLELAKTCQRFHGIIAHHCLYQELKLDTAPNNIRRIVRKFKNKQFNGNQVKRLEIHLGSLSNQLYRRLPVIFPNVTCFMNTRGKEGKRDDYIIEPMKHWMNKLQDYDMSKGQLQLDRLILSNTFSRITSLVLSPQIDILATLPNVPLLKRLALFNFELDIDYLELLHAKCATLTHFRLSSGLIRIPQDKSLPRQINPIQHLDSLIISNDVAISDQNCFFMDYIALKYVDLTHFEFLSSFKNNLLSLQRSTGYQNGSNIAHTEFETTRENYLKEGEARFLNKLISSINTFSLETSLFQNVFDGLTQSALNPTELQFHNFTDTQDQKLQLRYISTLTRLRKFTLTMEETEDPFSRECKSNSLEVLILTVKRKSRSNDNKPRELDLAKLLFCFPKLEQLVIHGEFIKITTNDPFAARTAHGHLRRLTLKRCILLPQVVNFFHNNLKSIEHLDYSMTKLISTVGATKNQPIKKYEMNLPDHRLKSLTLSRIHSIRSGQLPFVLYVEVNTGSMVGKFTVDTRGEDSVWQVKDITHNTIDLTCDVIDLTDLPEENENMTKLMIRLRDLKELRLDGYPKSLTLHKLPPHTTIID